MDNQDEIESRWLLNPSSSTSQNLEKAESYLKQALEISRQMCSPGLTRDVCVALMTLCGRIRAKEACFYMDLSMAITARNQMLLKLKSQLEDVNQPKTNEETDMLTDMFSSLNIEDEPDVMSQDQQFLEKYYALRVTPDEMQKYRYFQIEIKLKIAEIMCLALGACAAC